MIVDFADQINIITIINVLRTVAIYYPTEPISRSRFWFSLVSLLQSFRTFLKLRTTRLCAEKVKLGTNALIHRPSMFTTTSTLPWYQKF